MKAMNRRDFMGKTGKAVAGAMAMSALSYNRALGANERVKLALIGCGGRGTGITKAMAENENTEVKYACEINDARGEGFIKDIEKIQGDKPKRIIEMREVFADNSCLVWCVVCESGIGCNS